MKTIISILVCVVVLSAFPAQAKTLRGVATIEIQNKKTVLELTQIVTVGDQTAEFVNLDDWGSSSFTVRFEKGKLRFESADGSASTSLKRALSLPLNQDEFLAILHYRETETLGGSFVKVNCGTRAPTEPRDWGHKYNKNLRIHFKDYVNIPGYYYYPKDILITYKKNVFHLKWQKVELQE